MDTPHEIALSLLHDLLWPEGMDPGGWAAGRLARVRGRVDGTVAALVSVGVISAEEAEEWRAELLAAGGVAFVDAAYRDDASRILGAFLDAAQKTGDRGARLRYDGALSALAEIGAIDRAAWQDAFSAQFVVMRSEGEALEGEEAAVTELYPLIGTDQELAGVIAGPAELLEGWRVFTACGLLMTSCSGAGTMRWPNGVTMRRMSRARTCGILTSRTMWALTTAGAMPGAGMALKV